MNKAQATTKTPTKMRFRWQAVRAAKADLEVKQARIADALKQIAVLLGEEGYEGPDRRAH
jgi:hypothetical protein